MQVPVVSSGESWKRNKTKSLRKLKNDARGFLHFFSLWKKSLQKIGGKPLTVHFRWTLKGLVRKKLSRVRPSDYTYCILHAEYGQRKVLILHMFIPNEIMALCPHRELWRWCPFLLPVSAILGGSQFCFLFTDCWICPHPQHCLQICWDQPC